MNKWIWLIPIAIGCGSASIFWTTSHLKEKATMQEAIEALPENPKTLVVYYSHSGNTKAVAQMIGVKTGSELFEIEVAAPYPTDYNALVNQAKEELGKGYLPPIKGNVENLAAYDLIFIGSPNWWSTLAPPVMTFLANHDLQGKTVIPFITHGGGGVADCVKEMRKQAPGAAFGEALVLRDSRIKDSEENIAAWLNTIVKEKSANE